MSAKKTSSLSIADKLNDKQKEELLKEDRRYHFVLLGLSIKKYHLRNEIKRFRVITYQRLLNYTIRLNYSNWEGNLRDDVTSNPKRYLEPLINKTEDRELIEKYKSFNNNELASYIIEEKLREFDPLVYRFHHTFKISDLGHK